MMSDKIEKIGTSLIQHGGRNDRVYIMKLSRDDFAAVLDRTESLCREREYSKVFAKVPASLSGGLLERGYVKEAEVDGLFRGGENGLFLGKFLKPERRRCGDEERIAGVKRIAGAREVASVLPALPPGCRLRMLRGEDAEKMAALYGSVFASYPFPIFDPESLRRTMDENVEYGGVFRGEELLSVASAEKSPESLNAEMTDFATSGEGRGNNLSLIILGYLQERLAAAGYRTLYTIARALSAPMNITFKKAGYRLSGTLVNNTDIGGGIESMNVWHRPCR